MPEGVLTKHAARSQRGAASARRTTSERTCAGCRGKSAPEELVRVVRGPDGEVAVDLAARAFGRGAWVHAREACLLAAAQKGLARSFRAPVRVDGRILCDRVAEAAHRRVRGLLLAARRARHVELGTDRVCALLSTEQVHLLLVACDARAAVQRDEIGAAVSRGIAVAWGTRDELGDLLGRGEIAVAAVLDPGLADALSRAVNMCRLPSAPDRGSESRDEELTEVR